MKFYIYLPTKIFKKNKMKKLLLLPAVALMMASCGGTDVCSCKAMADEMQEKMKEAMKDVDPADYEAGEKAMAALEEEYKADIEACEKLQEEMVKGLEGDDLKAKKKEMKKEYEACK